jgi:hypothetical protein
VLYGSRKTHELANPRKEKKVNQPDFHFRPLTFICVKRTENKYPTITLVKGTDKEKQTKERLVHIFEQYPLEKWRYSEQIQIEEGFGAYSHPVIKLGTWEENETEQQILTTYIHEQLHWFCMWKEKFESASQARREFREMYPELPVTPPEGCGSSFANYLHVLVNSLEYQGLSELIGAAEARKTFERKPSYTKINELVLQEQERINAVLSKYDLFPPAQPPEEKWFVEVK